MFLTASDLDCIRALFNEKEKELSLAVAKVEELTRQLEDLRGRHNIVGNNGGGHLPTSASAELEKLRRELLVTVTLYRIFYLTRPNARCSARGLLIPINHIFEN